MDAVKFLREKKRMCESPLCDQCELWKNEIDSANMCCNAWMEKNVEKAVAFVEKWAAEHPVKTRQSEFLKMFPYVRIGPEGSIDICKLQIDYTETCKSPEASCVECRRDYWSQEVTE